MSLASRIVARYRAGFIAVPPRSLGDLIQSVLRKLNGVSRMKEIVEKISHDREDTNGYSYFRDRANVDENDLANYVYTCERTYDSVQNFAESLKYGSRNFDIDSTVNDFLEHKRLVAFADSNPQVLETAAAEAGGDDPFSHKVFGLFKEFHTLLHQFVDAMRTLKTKAATWHEWAEQMQNDQDAPLPKHEKIETLYHASIYALDLFRNGFSISRPGEGGLGLGGSVSDKAGNDAISFTYNQKYALEIARWFKEVAMVNAGEIKPHQILRWAEEEHCVPETLKILKATHGACSDSNSFSMMKEGITCLTEENGHWKVTLEKYDRELNRPVTIDGDPDQIFRTPDDTYALYYAYLSTSKHRENPMGNMEALLHTMQSKHVDPKGIGVIIAEVDMSDPDIMHKPGEWELRVPVRAIRKVVKFL